MSLAASSNRNVDTSKFAREPPPAGAVSSSKIRSTRVAVEASTVDASGEGEPPLGSPARGQLAPSWASPTPSELLESAALSTALPEPYPFDETPRGSPDGPLASFWAPSCRAACSAGAARRVPSPRRPPSPRGPASFGAGFGARNPPRAMGDPGRVPTRGRVNTSRGRVNTPLAAYPACAVVGAMGGASAALAALAVVRPKIAFGGST